VSWLLWLVIPHTNFWHNRFLGLALIFIVIQMFILKAINKKRDEQYGPPDAYTSDMRRAEMDRGDQASFFRYSI
jgi:hypothetical protein